MHWIRLVLPAVCPTPRDHPREVIGKGTGSASSCERSEREVIEGVVHARSPSQWNGIDNEFHDDLRLPGDRPADVAGPARRTGAPDWHARVPDRAAGAAGGVPAVAAAGGLPPGRARTVRSAPGGRGRDPEADGRVVGANGGMPDRRRTRRQRPTGTRTRCRGGRTAGREAGRRQTLRPSRR